MPNPLAMKKRTMVLKGNCSAYYAVGKDKEIIVEELKEAGFTNIVEKENTSGWAKSGLVSRVEIDDRERYHKGYYRKPDSTSMMRL